MSTTNDVRKLAKSRTALLKRIRKIETKIRKLVGGSKKGR